MTRERAQWWAAAGGFGAVVLLSHYSVGNNWDFLVGTGVGASIGALSWALLEALRE